MRFLWPGYFILLGLIPLLAALYILALRRRRTAIRYSSLELVRAALPRRSSWRRHIPVALFLLSIAGLVLALTRPVVITSVPTNETTIILTIDVSGSMRSRDIAPNRLQAAENAAFDFIQHQKANTNIGIVAFSTYAEIVQAPTANQEVLQEALSSLTVGRRTAIGSGILKAIDAIAQVDSAVAPSTNPGQPGIEPKPVPKGAYAPDIIVLLTDGVSNSGVDPVAAAKEAADRGIRIYTIGFGTVNGPDQNQNPFGFGGGFGGGNFTGGNAVGGAFRLGLDEKGLTQIATMTGGDYHVASSASDLEKVFNSLPTYLIVKHDVIEISVLFAALGAALAAISLLLSILWHPLP